MIGLWWESAAYADAQTAADTDEYQHRFGRRPGPVQPAFEGYVPSGEELE